MNRLKALGPYFIAVITLAVLCTIASTHFVLAGLQDAGAQISMADRLSMTGYDIIHMGPLLGVFTAIGLALALPAAHFTINRASLPAALVFAAAGAVCMGVMLFLMERVFFDLQIIAGARSAGGFAAMVAAGALAGLVYAAIKKPTA